MIRREHDDLGMSPAMLAWAVQHLHLDRWQQPIFARTGHADDGKNMAGHPSSKQPVNCVAVAAAQAF